VLFMINDELLKRHRHTAYTNEKNPSRQLAFLGHVSRSHGLLNSVVTGRIGAWDESNGASETEVSR